MISLKKSAGGSYEEVKTPGWLSFEGSGGNQSYVLNSKLLTNLVTGLYKFELPLTDENNNVFIETLVIKLIVMD